jgi:hypothetical protein
LLSRTTLERCTTAYLFILPFGTIGDICAVALHLERAAA